MACRTFLRIPQEIDGHYKKEKTSPFKEKFTHLKSSTFTLSMQRWHTP